MRAYKQKNYEQALIETYLKFDELLRLEKVNQFLKDNYNHLGKDKLGVKFSNGVVYGGGDGVAGMGVSNFILQTPPVKKKSENFENLNFAEPKKENSTKKIGIEGTVAVEDKSGGDIFLAPKEKIIDLTTRSVYSSSGDGSKNSRSKEILILDNEKIEISLKSPPERSEDYDDLVAKDMGTTANILLIKNNYIYLANVGDSLSVIFKNGQAIRINQEHKTTLPSEYTRITKSGAKVVNNRVEGRLNLTRAIGML
jgi:hypothetical protein